MNKSHGDHALTFQLDVANTNQDVFDDIVKQAVDKFGRIDVLVNNAGYGSVTFFEETDEETKKTVRSQLSRGRLW